MALLDIHKLETDLVRQPSRGDIIICQALEVIVIYERIIEVNSFSCSLICNRPWIQNWIVKGDQRPAIAVAP